MQAQFLRSANDHIGWPLYAGRMSKTRPKRYTNWYLREWMAATNNMSQAALIEATGIDKAVMSLLYNNQQDYSPEYIRDISEALNISSYELLLHPRDAMAIRNMLANAAEGADLGRRLKVVSDRTGTDG